MRLRSKFHSLVVYLALVSGATAQAAQFDGTWSIDLRTPEQKERNAECGLATFKLSQNGDGIAGDHMMATADCGRVNEGGEDSVKGVVVGQTAILVVTSARNGQIVLGTARVEAGALRWRMREEVRAGEPQGDSGLILSQGVLRRVKE